MRTPEDALSPDERNAAAIDPPAGREPFEALDDLMAVIEALCPSWPPRPTFVDSAPFIL